MKGCCRLVDRWLSAWTDGELGAVRRRVVSAHLARCARCRRSERVHQRARQLAIEALRMRGEPAIDEDAVWLRLRAHLADERPLAARPRRIVLAAVLAGTVLVVAGVYVSDWGIALGWRQPPAELRRHPELFRDYAFFEQVEIPSRGATRGGGQGAGGERSGHGGSPG